MFVSAWAAFGQSFEVASIKPRQGPIGSMFQVSSSGPRFTCQACPIRPLVLHAYNLQSYQIYFPQSFTDYETVYDIVAKADGDTTPSNAQFRQMLQSLLADRFKLKVHRELREIPVHAVVIGKNGSKLKESAGGEHRWNLGVDGGTYRVNMQNVAIDEIISAISHAFSDGLPVVDRTGLSGTYDATLTYTPSWAHREGGPDIPGISIFDAVEKQLGLKLTRQKMNLEIVVVDHVEKPSEN
jgi:bla regulator protein blaR1